MAKTPIFISDNTSRDFFSVTPDEVREELDQFPQDYIQSITHIWFRKHSDEDIKAKLICLCARARYNG